MKNDLLKLWKKYASDEHLPAADLLPKELLSSASERVFSAGSVIVSAGDFPEFIYFVLSGTVRGVKLFENGEYYQYFSLDTRNGGIGLLELFAQKSAFVATIIATSEVKTLALPSDIYYEYVLRNPELMRVNLYYMARDLYRSSAKDGMLFFKDGLERVKYFLADYYSEASSASGERVVSVDSDYETIAVTLGLSVRTVGRSVKKLRDEGFVGKSGRRLTVNEEQYKRLTKEFERW